MTNRRSDRLQRVFRLSETEEQAQCRRMGDAQRRLDEAAAQLDELKTWRKSYAERRQQSGHVAGAHWQDYQRFLERLDEAIEVQARAVQNGVRDRDLHRQRWLARRQQAESLERVVTRCRDEEAAERERALQKASDDLPANGTLVRPISR